MAEKRERHRPSSFMSHEAEKIKKWSDDDKRLLLKALRKFGHSDISNISRMIQHKPPAEIKRMIHNTMMKARRVMKDQKLPPIDHWLQCAVVNGMDTLIPQALLFISLFEKHPPPEQSNGCDFRDAYDFLYRMTLGHLVTDLSSETRQAVYQLISKMVHEVRPSNMGQVLKHVHATSKIAPINVYPPKTKKRRQMGIHEVLEQRDINTFAMPLQELSYQQVDDDRQGKSNQPNISQNIHC